jgi:hypothetical protein
VKTATLIRDNFGDHGKVEFKWFTEGAAMNFVSVEWKPYNPITGSNGVVQGPDIRVLAGTEAIALVAFHHRWLTVDKARLVWSQLLSCEWKVAA